MNNRAEWMPFTSVFSLLTVNHLTLMTYPWKELKPSVQMKMEVAAQANLIAKKVPINRIMTWLTQHCKGSLLISYGVQWDHWVSWSGYRREAYQHSPAAHPPWQIYKLHREIHTNGDNTGCLVARVKFCVWSMPAQLFRSFCSYKEVLILQLLPETCCLACSGDAVLQFSCNLG